MSRFQWTSPPSRAWDTRKYKVALQAAIGMALLSWAPRIETDAKMNATWTDRTANARQGLRAFVWRVDENRMALILAHSMEYGKWLELRRAGRYAIIMPTLTRYYAQVWANVQQVIR